MTNPETICECGHISKLHIRENHQYGSKGCLYEDHDGISLSTTCSCEKFIKEND